VRVVRDFVKKREKKRDGDRARGRALVKKTIAVV